MSGFIALEFDPQPYNGGIESGSASCSMISVRKQPLINQGDPVSFERIDAAFPDGPYPLRRGLS